MIPVAIESPAGACFGTYHAAGGAALLILPLWGYEALSTYRVWRELADRLAAGGIAVLRLDLPGTGDSAGVAEMADPVGAHRAAVDAGVAWLAARHGAVSILGARFGALLAVDAAGRGAAVRSLVLLDAPADGAALARQLRARSRLEPGGTEDRRAYGVPLTDAMLAGLAGLPVAPQGQMETLLIGEAQGRPPAWSEGLRIVEAAPFEERDAFVMRDSFQRMAPAAAFGRVVAFLAGRAGTVPVPEVGAGALILPGMREEPVWFGPGLFGVLTVPDGAPRGVAALIPSTGNLPRSGPGRASVLLARRLAAAGFATLRYDCAGVGDSEGAIHGDPAVETYLPEQVGHVALAVNVLAGRGFGRVVVVGHCSGAYLGWHAAAGNAGIVGVFAINLQILKRMDAADAAATVRPHGTPTGSAGAAEPPRGGGLKALVRRACPPWLWDWLRSMTAEERGVRRQLRGLVRRGCRVHFVFGTEEDEQYRFHRAFGRPPRLPAGAELTVIEGADHMFSAARHRTRLLDLAAGFVASHDTGATRGGERV